MCVDAYSISFMMNLKAGNRLPAERGINMNTKRIVIALVVAAALVAAVVLVVAKDKNDGDFNDMELGDIVDKLYDGVDAPAYEKLTLDSKNFESYAFIPYKSGLSGMSADALVNITPHSLVVIRAENGDARQLAKKVYENANMNKWLCVAAEVAEVGSTDHYVVLVMSDRNTATAIMDNFYNMAAELEDGDPEFMESFNSERYGE